MTYKGVLVVLVGLAMWCVVAQAETDYVIWPTALDTRYEIRAGADFGDIGAYVAPSYNVTTDVWGVRAYGMYDVIDANMVANWLGTETPLPAGSLYAGLFGGWKAGGDKAMEAGWTVGGAVEIRPGVAWTTEYEHSFTTFNDESDRFAVVTGLRITLK